MKIRKSIASLSVAAVMSGSMVALPAATAQAAPNPAQVQADQASRPDVYYPLPVTGVDQNGAAFQGMITRMRVYVEDGKLMATGALSTVNSATGQQVSVPFTTQVINASVNGTRRAATGSGAVAQAQIPSGCTILHLELAPLQLDVLGLVVTLPNPLVVDITAVPGAGNLLGNLLCTVAGLLDGNPLGNLLNSIAALLNRLLSGLGL